MSHRGNSSVESNFGRNVSFVPAIVARPVNVQEVLDLLDEHQNLPVRAVASRHAWSEGIKTSGLLLSLEKICEIRISENRETVFVGAGCKIKDLLKYLAVEGLTLPSVGLIDEQTVAGATATGTHGSGKHSLSHYVVSVQIAHHDADSGTACLTRLDRGDELKAARCSLGALGVVVEVELQVRPSYNVSEYLQRHDSLSRVLSMEKDCPLQQFFFMPWSWHFFGQHRKETDHKRSLLAPLYRLYWHVGIDWGLHLVLYLLAKIVRVRSFLRGFYRFVVPLTIIRNRKVTDDSHKMLTMEHELFRHIEIEIFVTRSRLEESLSFLKSALSIFGSSTGNSRNEIGVPDDLHGSYFHHYPICVRRLLTDDTLISMSTPSISNDDEDWYAISLISLEWISKRNGFFGFADWLAPAMATRFGARCHWGKYFPLDRKTNDVLYPQIEAFRKIAMKFDPDRRFANDWLEETLL
ncbi:MAG: FAD-binding protein [Planctomycetota bacterium]